jgi:hypothetical protein
MRSNYLKTLKTAVLAVTVLLLGASAAMAQVTVGLTAAPTAAILPDGSVVPMWGYTCGTVAATGPGCRPLNPTAAGWSPVVITVPTGQDLTINLTNNLSFGATPNNVPTSLVIVGQLGGGLGDVTKRTTTPSPTHVTQKLTWPTSSSDPLDGANNPPPQPDRVQSFATEVAATPAATAQTPTALTWTAENLRPGTYLIESGTHPSIQGPMGLYGILVVTTAPSGATPGTAYPASGTALAVSYNAEIPLLLSEIDPVQNAAVDAAVRTAGFSETKVWSGQLPNGCGYPGPNPATPTNPNFHTCYPPVVNYSPLYYLVNGAAFNKTTNLAGTAGSSLFATSPATVASGTVLVRLVNAGLRMHVPSIVGAQTGPVATPASGFGLIAEDGNPLPGLTRVQSEVFLAPGKTYDVMINVPAAGGTALPIFDRQGSLSQNATGRDGGMLAYISINGAGLPAASVLAAAAASPDTYNSVIAGTTLTVSDPAKGVLANDVNVYGAKVMGSVAGLTLNTNGTFTYTGAPTTFTYCGNGATSGPACALVTLGAGDAGTSAGITCTFPSPAFTSNVAKTMSIKPPGVLQFCKDAAGYPLTVAKTPAPGLTSGSVSMDPNGGFVATVPSASLATYTLSFTPQNSRGTSGALQNVSIAFPAANGPAVTLVDGISKSALSPQDYRWIIEEDRTFFVDPNCQANPLPAGCPIVAQQSGQNVPAVFGTNFHTSYMPIVAQGCVGSASCESGQSVLGASSVCDIGNGDCRPGTTKTAIDPTLAALDTTKHYYISVLPGDAADGGHAMGGAQLVYLNGAWRNTTAPTATGVQIIVEPMGQESAKVSAFVFEDDHPLNGEHDASGGIDTVSPNEPGLGGFNITIIDLAGMSGDSSGQLTFDEFGQPLSNSLAGTVDPVSGFDACPITPNSRSGVDGETGITGMIPVCPKYEADGTSLSPLAGQAIVVNMPPGRYGIIATPAADRIARGEEWLQTNTLDGGKDHEAFLKINEPAYFQEFGPAGYHVSIGFANPKWINDAGFALCNGPGHPNCNQSVTGTITGARMSRTSDQRLYGSGSRDTFGYTQCYASLGSPDGADIAFAKCADDGSFTLSGIPAGDWKLTIFDQWNDQIVDGISTPVRAGAGTNASLCHGLTSSATVCDMGEISVHGWKNNLSTRTFFDVNGDGVSNIDSNGNPTEQGLSLVPTNIRYRDGSVSNFNSTDLAGFAGFNEVFPIFSWYVMETDSNRYKSTGTHVVNDAGGPADGTSICGKPGFPACGNSIIGTNMARTMEDFSVPTNLRVPGSYYCSTADCTDAPAPLNHPASPAAYGTGGSTGRVDPPGVTTYGWQSFMGQNQFLEFGKKPFAQGETGGIRGHVVYASTRPFDDPQLLLQLSWEPQVPGVTINLYQEGFAADGITPTLRLVDTTKTSSWDDWAQGFRSDGVPNMNCPGQNPVDPFIYTLTNQPSYLDWYNAQHGGAAVTQLPNGSRYKCYDGMHNWNQLLPAPYDGMYSFPSVTGLNPITGKPAGTSCHMKTTAEPWGCVPNPTLATSTIPNDPNLDPYRSGTAMLPAGKYVVEMIVPPGYELVKEEDKNLFTGDAFNGPVTTQFAGFGNIFIMPDQASVSAYNGNNNLNPTTDLGVQPRHEGDTGSVETFWPCVGAARIVPDYNSIFPGLQENAPFAGAKRNLCDRKEVILEDQMSVLAKFYVFTSTDIAGRYTGIITDDFTSEFDPFSPSFGEKFSPPNLPVGIRDWAGNEIARVYSDQFGMYDGLTYSSWTVNPPDPSGYIPQTMNMCMNDRGSGPVADPFYQPAYSQFCYVWTYMPGQTSYMDTPVIPTSAFAAEYNHPDCAYPDATPAISRVDGDGDGPWVQGTSGHVTFTVTALGDQVVSNYGYSGPSVNTSPYNKKTVIRHYGFGGAKGTLSVGSYSVPPDNITTWNDTTIVFTVPLITASGLNVPACSLQQQPQYGGPAGTTASPNARCGELVIKATNGNASVDTVTLTIGGKAPTRLTAGQTIQSAIDAAAPGDLIIVPPGNHHELVVMWKPVRLQGVGAASAVIDANAHPSGILNDWRRRMVCLFGLSPNGVPDGYSSSCGSNPNANGSNTPWAFFRPTTSNPQVDRLPLEAMLGWDAQLNGNLAEQLQEPTLLGAYEGAGITVVSKGVRVPEGADPWSDGATPAAFPAGTTLLQNTPGVPGNSARCTANPNLFPSNFSCNPSRIDGLSVINSSQGGGGIYVHGWAHNLEIANNRVHNNEGTAAGGITIGQGEHPDGYLVGGIIGVPGSCQNSNTTNVQLPYCFDVNVNVHHNAVYLNSSEGDELFSATPSGAGGVAFCSGSDNYQFNFNWVCGNLTTGDGAGVSHLGFAYNGSIRNNAILFNQATNPTTPSNGGGVLIMSAPDTDPLCPGEPDADCSHAFGSVGDGVGPGLVIDANLIMGNAAEAGSGGGIRFQGVNGVEVGNFARNPDRWYMVKVTNNIITNNVAGWDGAGVSLQDSIGVNLINNTIVSNDSTASSGTLFGAFFAPEASAPTPCGRDANGASIRCIPLSTPQPAGISSGRHSAEFLNSLPNTITCPAGHPFPSNGNPNNTVNNGACRSVSFPMLLNNVLWQNRAFNIAVPVAPATGAQQVLVTLMPQLNQLATGDCVAPTAASTYWDIGLRGDTGPTNHSSGFTFQPKASVLSPSVNLAQYPGGPNTGTNTLRGNTTSFSPGVVRQYCNGSKIPPEAGKTAWYQVPPGTFEGNVPTPVFNLTAGATVDEGNNWINISWGPLSVTRPSDGVVLGNYSLLSGSPAIDYIATGGANSSSFTYAAAPGTDFFGNPRKTGNSPVDAGAVEFGASGGGGGTPATVSITPNPLTITLPTGTFTGTGVVTLTNTAAPGGASVTVSNVSVTGGSLLTYFFNVAANTCTGPLAPGAACTVTVRFTNVFSARGVDRAGTITFTDNAAGSPQSSGLIGHAN